MALCFSPGAFMKTSDFDYHLPEYSIAQPLMQ